MAYRVLIVPRWAGGSKDDFYPWLVDRIGNGGVPGADRAEALDLPDAQGPQPKVWAHLVAARIEEDPASTILVGHSVGAQAVLRALAMLPDGLRVPGFLAVAGWRTVDQPWPTIEPWIDTPIDGERVRAAVGRGAVLLSDDDPYTRDHQATASWFRDAFGATAKVIPGAKHFNRAAEPDVAEALAVLIASLGK